MEFWKGTVWLTLTAVLQCVAGDAFQCELSDNCLCYQPTPSTYEFNCPPESPTIKIQTNLNEVEVECLVDINWDTHGLPKLNINYVRSLKIFACPLPNRGVSEILQKLGLNSTYSLQYSFSNVSANWTMSSKDLDNLSGLKVLDFSDNSIETFEENAFEALVDLHQLDLSRNLIEALSGKSLQALSMLKELNLSRNGIEVLPEGIFAKNKRLEVLDLGGNPINLTTVPVKDLSGLKTLRLSNARIENFPQDFFATLSQLEDLDLTSNKIAILDEFIFHPLTKLRLLSLENNYLSQITKRLLHNNVNLKKVNFKNNTISFINIHAFQRNTNLAEIILANNKFKLTKTEISLGVSPFQANINLERLDLSRNRITDISDDWVLSKIYLKTLDLSYNEISALLFTDLMGVASNLSINLSHNKISTVDFRMVNHIDPITDQLQPRIVTLDENPLICDCFIYDFARYFDGTLNPLVPATIKITANNLKCAGPKTFANASVTDIKSVALKCDVKNCPSRCNCGFRAWDKALIIDCANRNLTVAPILMPEENLHYNYTEIDLQGNELKKGPYKYMGYDNVNKLNLAFNNISTISWIPPKLQMLDLTHNNIEHLDENLLYMFNGSPLLTNLLLGNNPWKCGCSALSFRSFMITHLISKRMIDADNIKCKNDGRLVIHLSINDVCLTFSSLVVMCSLALALMASAISILTCVCAFSRRKKLYTPF